ncbi:S8 family serine peptidase [Bacillus sp. CMF12]|uniref:S8 family serine peptidase n=1 Tax=Bacillaceae TaxID=186817 RepID=UPI001FB46D89|nr:MULTISPECIES: S8 family serine peptidase [Bacillaceae]UOE56721.1 S8 family serine peptidase [Cytobacillus oceanisediminis]USK51210.1 S8 family serine peptidase [Bacillus sp. CMF12]
MKRKKIRKILTGTLAVGMLLSQGTPYNVLAKSTYELNPVDHAEEILKSLSSEQRKALEQLDAKPNFTISQDINVNSPELVKVIVEFEQAPAKIEVMKQAAKGTKLSTADANEKVKESHKAFIEHVQSLKSQKNVTKYKAEDVKITREYTNAINGVAMTLPGVAVQDLLQSGVVKRIFKDYEVKVEPPVKTKEVIDPKMADSIPQIGVDKLHAENITGKGIKVGVLDTGVDYNHPDLKEAYKGGYDFIDNDADPMETTYEDWINAGKPEYPGLVYYTNHGTHVAGTIAAQKKNNVDYAVKGVAPEVDLYAYRVLGPWGGGDTAGILAGIDQAIADSMDVINMSLGARTNDPLYATSVATNNAMLSGVVTVVAAGNSGPGEKTLGSPGTAALGISVGASDASMSIPTFNGSASGEKFENMQLLGKDFSDRLAELQGQSLPIVFAGLGKAADFAGKDVNGKLALIQRGEITFDEKIKNAKNAGAKAVIVYNNVDGQISAYLGESVGLIPSFRLSKADGERLKGLGESSFTFETLSNTKTEGDHLADFSSRGPVNGNYDIKPDVVAPGVSVFSTAPEFINDPQDGINYGNAYVRLSGTSMAAPHTAGTAALILQEHPEYTPFDVKSALMNTSDDLKGDYSVYEVGAGRIDAYQAVHTDTSIKVWDKTKNIENGNVVEIDEQTGSIVFGRYYKKGDAPIEASKKVTVQNNSQEEKSFNLEVEYHGERKGIQDAVKNGVKVAVPSSITVGGGQEQELQPKITIPTSAAAGRYEGYIHVTNVNNPAESYQIPFAVMVTEKGFDYAKTSSPSVTNTTPFWQYMYPFVHVIMKLNSPVKTIDVLVKDSKTGKAVGFIGTANTSKLSIDVETFLINAFAGTVYPFTNDPSKPIGDLPVKLPAGDYILELIGHDEEGKTYVVDNPLIVDNTAPEVNLDKKPGVIEINDSMFTEEDGQKAVWLHGTAKDATVDLLKSKGLNYDQSSNTMGYSANSGFIDGYFPIQANGDVKFGIEESDIATKPLHLTLTTYDIATAMGKQNYVFVKEGTEYTTSSYDKKDVKIGDTVTMTLSLNNVKQLVSGEYQVEFMNDLFKFENVKLNNAVNEYAKERGLEVSLQEPVVKEGTHNNTVKVGASMKGDAFSGMDGDMPFLDVTFKVVSDAYFDNVIGFNVQQASYMKAGQTAATAIPYFRTENFNIIPTHSRVQGSIQPEAFLIGPENSQYLRKADYTKIGAQVYAMSPSGKKYKGTIDNRGFYTIHGIPASTEAHTVVIDVPGHLKVMKKFIPGYSVNGEMRGQHVRLGGKGLAGDVNDDSMIDILDIQSITEAYGTNDPSIVPQDINQDGVVDETDIRFVEKNFLTKGPDAPAKKEPKESLGNGKKDLAYFLRLVGLEPKQ